MTSESDPSIVRPGSWTAREIAQQPTMWRSLARSLDTDRQRIDGFLTPLLADEDLRIVLTGAGTSAFAGQILAPGLARTLRRRIDAVATTDIVSNPREHLAEDVPTLLVSFARSGDSPESLAAVELADRLLTRCHHLVVTCNPDGQLTKDRRTSENSLVILMPPATNDHGFAMTSSFTCMMLTVLDVLGGHHDTDRLAEAGALALADLEQRAEKLATGGFDRFVFLGSGPLNGLARESALKLLELSAGQAVSYFDSALGFRHGPKAVLTDSTAVLVYVSNDPHTRRYDLDILAELRIALPPGNVVAIGTHAEPSPETWSFPSLADLADEAVAPVFVLPAQHLALAYSLSLGLEPDNPFPDGSVNRVVEGVTIHGLVD